MCTYAWNGGRTGFPQQRIERQRKLNLIKDYRSNQAWEETTVLSRVSTAPH